MKGADMGTDRDASQRVTIRSGAARLPLALLALLVALGGLLIAVPAGAAEPVPTTTTLRVQGGKVVGDSITLVATVKAAGRLPRGSVQFTANDEPVGEPVALTLVGRASRTFPALLGLNVYGAVFVPAGGYAASSAETLHMTTASGVRLTAQGILSAGLRPTLTPGATARHLVSGKPIVGLTLVFTAGGQRPNPFDAGGGEVICVAVTNARGYATCGEAGKRPASFWRSLPAYVSGGQLRGTYAFASAQHPMRSLL